MDSDIIEITSDEFTSNKLHYSNLTPFYCSNSIKILLNKLKDFIQEKRIINVPSYFLDEKNPEITFLNLF